MVLQPEFSNQEVSESAVAAEKKKIEEKKEV